MPHPIPSDITRRYIAARPNSVALTERARRVLPGGDTRTGTWFAPFPTFMAEGRGPVLTDVDGNTYLDFLNNFTSLVHGHAHPELVAAAREQLPHGTVFASPMQAQVELAELLCARVPSVERVRFCNSGTEATMLALRAARAFSRKSGVLKMRGGYHGSHDLAAATPDPDADRGIPEGLRRDIYFASFNDAAEVERILAEHRAHIAALLVEPVPNAGGLPIPRPGYLRRLRELTDRYDVLLVFDEVVTLRLSPGGYQQMEGVMPDLTAMGKIIGGGLAVGAVGGRDDIMQVFDPRNPSHVTHSGTFNGHAATMRAGLASLRLLDAAAIRRIDALGESLAQGFDDAFQEAGVAGHTTSAGSLVQVHWGRGEISNMEDVARGHKAAGDVPYLAHLELMNAGIFSAARGEYNISTVMNPEHVARAVTAFNDMLQQLKPYIAAEHPELLAV